MNVSPASVPAGQVTPAQRDRLRELTSSTVAVVDLASPGLLGSMPANVTFDPRGAIPLAATNLDEAIAAATGEIGADPFGQARGIVDAGTGALWLLNAQVRPIGDEGYTSSPATPRPLYNVNGLSKGRFSDVADGVLAIVGDTKAITL